MISTNRSETEHFMRDADGREDQLIILILKKMNSVYAGRLLYFVELAGLPGILLILSAVIYYVLKNRLGPTFLIAPLAVSAFTVPSVAANLQMRRQNSGIKYDIRKYGEHFLIGKAVCIAKNEKTSFLGKRLYSLSAKLPGGRILENIPVFGPHYQSFKEGKELWLVKSSNEQSEVLFALPKYVLQPSAKTKKTQEVQAAADIGGLLRPLSEEDRKIALDFNIHRNRQRIRYYGRAYLICLVCSLAFFVTALVQNSRYINLSIVVLCCLAAAIIMYLLESRQFNKMISDKRSGLYCLDAKVSRKAADNGKYIEIEDLNGNKIYRSTAPEDYRMLEKGSPVLLIYRDGRDKPIICLKNPPEPEKANQFN